MQPSLLRIRSTLGCTIFALAFILAPLPARSVECQCPPNTEITEMVTICVGDSNYTAFVTHCTQRLVLEPCGLYSTTDDAITYFKKICVVNGPTLSITDVLRAVLCVYDPCRGNKIGAVVPNCDPFNANKVWCWSYGFPQCMTRDTNNCIVACDEQTVCCFRTRRYCKDAATGNCHLIAHPPGIPVSQWTCGTAVQCPQNCVATECLEPACVCD